jgi:hypothetical protein
MSYLSLFFFKKKGSTRCAEIRITSGKQPDAEDFFFFFCREDGTRRLVTWTETYSIHAAACMSGERI